MTIFSKQAERGFEKYMSTHLLELSRVRRQISRNHVVFRGHDEGCPYTGAKGRTKGPVQLRIGGAEILLRGRS